MKADKIEKQKEKIIGWKLIDEAILNQPHFKLQENMLQDIPFNTPLFIKEKTKSQHTIMFFISYKKQVLYYTLVDVLSAQQIYNSMFNSDAKKRFSEKQIKIENIDFDKSFTIYRIETRTQQHQQPQQQQTKKKIAL